MAAAVLASATAPALSAFETYQLIQVDGQFVKWGRPQSGAGATVRYGVVSEPMSFLDAANCGELAPIDKLLSASGVTATNFESEIAAAFAAWQRVANIAFRRAKLPSEAQILIGAQGRPRGRAYANVAYRQADGTSAWAAPRSGTAISVANDGSTTNRVMAIERALICLNPDLRWKVGFDGERDAYDLRYVIAHEIGHAIGLDHAGPSGQVMSFSYDESFRRLQPGDILGAIALYGPRGLPSVSEVTTLALDPE